MGVGGRPGGQDQAAGLRELMARHNARMIAVVEPPEPGRPQLAKGLAQALARAQRSVLFLGEGDDTRARHAQAGVWMQRSRAPHAPCSSAGEALSAFACAADFLLLDCPLQAGADLGRLASQAQDVVIVLDAGDVSGAALTAAYAGIKHLSARHAIMQFRIVPNECATAAAAQTAYQRLAAVAARYLTVRLHFGGFVPARASGREAYEQACSVIGADMLRWGR